MRRDSATYLWISNRCKLWEIMKTDQKNISTTETWESRQLGANIASAKRVSPEIHQQIDDALGHFARAEMKSLLSGMTES